MRLASIAVVLLCARAPVAYACDDPGATCETSDAEPAAPLLGEGYLPFGSAWDASRYRPWFFRFELGGGALGLSRHELTGATEHGDGRHPFSIRGADVRTVGPRFSVSLGLVVHPNVAIATYFSVAGGPSTLVAPVNFDGMAVELGGVMVGELGTTFGLTLPLGPVLLRAELVVAARHVGLDVNTLLGESSAATHLAMWDGAVRGQVAVDYFATPNGSVGLQLGYDPLQRELSAALRLTLHLRSYDAAYR